MPEQLIKNLIKRVFALRFIRFGIVGASGTVVNLGTLYLAQEFLFVGVSPEETRLNLSLALSIFIATINNFAWNRLWTWSDRKRHHTRSLLIQFIQYSMACWVSIAIQFVLTKLMAAELHYLVANLIAIITASISNYFINDRWTFSPIKYRLRNIHPIGVELDESNAFFPESEPMKDGSVAVDLGLHKEKSMNTSLPTRVLLGAVLLGVFTYFYALDSKNAPTNPSEGVYAHIARTTAESGHWLPLRSDLVVMRNTKPPMLFWQGIVSTSWAQDWDRFSLRLPSVLYTMATALMIFFLGRKLSGESRKGLLAVLMFFAFYNTYRYGRPFLTSAGEVFWFFLPFFVLSYCKDPLFNSRWMAPLWFGVAVGVGLLYKSFALLAPVGLALGLWYLHQRHYDWRTFFKQDFFKLILMGSVSLTIFALWFVFDPDPRAIIKEFVVGENIGKFNPGEQTYIHRFLWGSQSIWSHFISIFSNAGLMAPILAGLMWVSFCKRKTLTHDERLLWILFIVFFVFFSIPSYRSGRYLLPVMPAMALLAALRWSQIPRPYFVAVLALTGIVVSVLAWLSLHLSREASETVIFGPFYWAVITVTFFTCVIGLVKSDWSKDLAPIVAILTLLVLAGFLRLLDGPMGQFDIKAMKFIQSQSEPLGVPCDFPAKDESYHFEFPSANVQPYNQSSKVTRLALAERFPFFITDASAPDGCSDCKVIGQRFVVRGMQTSEEIKNSLRDGLIFPLLIGRQVLVDARAVHRVPIETNSHDCR